MREFVIGKRGDATGCVAYIQALDPGKAWSVTVKRHVKRRTLKQNAAYWARLSELVDAIADHTGYTSAVLHDVFKDALCPPKAVEFPGGWREVKSTTLLSTAEMALYFDAVAQWAATEFGIVLDDPIPAYVREEIEGE
jgi:hypothetical protein